jgi:hypothetical protein
MKKTLTVILGASALMLGAIQTLVLSSSTVGTVIDDPQVLTQITGSDCEHYQSNDCKATDCITSSGEVDGCNSTYLGTKTKTTCAPSSKTDTCGNTYDFPNCGG